MGGRERARTRSHPSLDKDGGKSLRRATTREKREGEWSGKCLRKKPGARVRINGGHPRRAARMGRGDAGTPRRRPTPRTSGPAAAAGAPQRAAGRAPHPKGAGGREPPPGRSQDQQLAEGDEAGRPAGPAQRPPLTASRSARAHGPGRRRPGSARLRGRGARMSARRRRYLMAPLPGKPRFAPALLGRPPASAARPARSCARWPARQPHILAVRAPSRGKYRPARTIRARGRGRSREEDPLRAATPDGFQVS